MSHNRTLTGITTSGTPHLGNYVGAIKPAVEQAKEAPPGEGFLFLADYHALVNTLAPERVRTSTLEVAAAWLACGLNPNHSIMYRQSEVPEILELSWVLHCVAAKGLLNRAHAYKDRVAVNTRAGDDPDKAVTMGLFSYPILMAADIVSMGATHVPVGKDQLQHIEMTRDMVDRFNHLYGEAVLTLPAAVIAEAPTLPGIDGRKMSKSYDNVVPFLAAKKPLQKAVMSIQTNSQGRDEPKDHNKCSIFAMYRALATLDQSLELEEAYREGIGWGDAKKRLLALLDELFGETREVYQHFLDRPDDVYALLAHGAKKARQTAVPILEKVRAVTGIR